MLKKSLLMLTLLAAGLVLFGAGCKSNPEWAGDDSANSSMVPRAANDPLEAPLNGELSDVNANGSKWTENAAELEGAGADKDGWVPVDPANRLGMPVIYFAYDSDELIPSEQNKVKRIAAYLADKNDIGLLIEGHCDQRGTEEYNRALGERRANAIREALENAGLAANRMKTQSFGKDKPAVEGNTPECWKQNRRGVPVPMRMPNK